MTSNETIKKGIQAKREGGEVRQPHRRVKKLILQVAFRAARERVVGCFSWEAMARVYFDVYLQVRQDDRIKQD